MAVIGETVGFDGAECNCGQELELKVCHSQAGWYLGYECPECGPHSRGTDYFATNVLALAALQMIQRTNQHRDLDEAALKAAWEREERRQ